MKARSDANVKKDERVGRPFDQPTQVRCIDCGDMKVACAVCKTQICQSCYPFATEHSCSGIVYE